MSSTISHQISLFQAHILNRRFDDVTLGIIESVMASKNANCSSEVRSRLRHFVRSESMSIVREGAQKPVDQKLLDLEFLVQTFALLGDFQSCLAMRYEALNLREFKSASHKWLEVSHVEWLNFAEQSLDYGFYSISIKACENALLCIKKNSNTNKATEICDTPGIIENIKKLKECAMELAATHSVQEQTARYTKSKPIGKTEVCSSVCGRKGSVASTLFRNGIRKRNLRNLFESQRLLRKTEESNVRET